MSTLKLSALALALLGSTAFLTTPSFAIEPDVDSPAGAELPAPRTDRPDFQQDDQSGAVRDPRVEGADPTPPTADVVVPVSPPTAEVIVPVPPPDNPSATSPGEENKGKPPVAPY
jgi:hypothetical protein